MISNDWVCFIKRRPIRTRHVTHREYPLVRNRTTSAQLCALGLLHFLNERGDDVEQITDYGDIRNLEDRRFGILVDSDNTTRSLHAHHVLNCATDTECQIQFGGYRLAG